MEKIKFIYQIEAETHFAAMIRVVTTFTRRRISINEMNAVIHEWEDRQRISISVEETKPNAVKIAKKLEQEIDILKVNLFEHSTSN